jgi:hypothetical protein
VNFTETELLGSLLALLAFFPVAVCTGYLVCWLTDLNGFRRCSLVERIFWSIPSSIAISTISSVLIAWASSLTLVTLFFQISAALWLVSVGWEWRQRRLSSEKWTAGWRPFGAFTAALAVAGIVVVMLSLVDFQYDNQLFMSLTLYDHGARVSWIDSVLRSGVPPANPLYQFGHSGSMRNYYFWYVICAAVARMAHVPARAALMASCVWSAFALASITGLYLKHFLTAGAQLRKQFLAAIFLLAVSGLDILIHTWNFLFLHFPIFDRAGVWPEINSWSETLLLAPHHIASLVCCMFAFLLAWVAGKDAINGQHRVATTTLLIAFSFASAFGLSVYVGLAFFLLMLAWGLWQFGIEHEYRSALLLISGGAASAVLLAPYLLNLTQTTSGIQGGSSPFEIAIRETFPPDGLLSTHFFQQLGSGYPGTARNLANLFLLIPGILVELGFFFAIFLLYLVPALHAGKKLNPASRSLVFIAAAGVVLSSVMKSSALQYNDFGFRAALFAQFSLLLLAAETVTAWNVIGTKPSKADNRDDLPSYAPQWLRSITTMALVLGVLSSVYYAAMFRFAAPLIEAKHKRVAHDPIAGNLSHDAYISSIGYAELNALIPLDAIVQFNPSLHNEYWTVVNLVGINRQTAIVSDKPWCGAELGGDPTGCPAMGASIGALYKGASAEDARATCRQYGIQFLIATIYDPPWKDRRGWAWNLKPVVQDKEFRALDCRE